MLFFCPIGIKLHSGVEDLLVPSPEQSAFKQLSPFLFWAGVFLGLGLSGLVPTLHFMISEGFIKATTVGQIGWLFLMAVLYILGVALYAARIPERFFPGKCDIWVCIVAMMYGVEGSIPGGQGLKVVGL